MSFKVFLICCRFVIRILYKKIYGIIIRIRDLIDFRVFDLLIGLQYGFYIK